MRPRARKGFSLVEVLVVAVLLSGGFLAILATLHGSRRGGAVTGRRLVAQALLRNMRERYRLLSVERLEALFGGVDGGEERIAADGLLNAPPWTPEKIRSLGLHRRITFGVVRGRPWLAILRCSVSYEGFGARRIELVARDVLSHLEGEQDGEGRGVPTVEGRPLPKPSRSPEGGPKEEGRSADGGLALWVQSLKRVDERDGTLDYRWDDLVAGGGDDALVELGRYLAGRRLPDGDYAFRHEALPGRLGAGRARIWLLEDREANCHLALWSVFHVDPLTGEFLSDEAAGGEGIYLFAGAPARILGLRRQKGRTDSWGLLVATARRILVIEEGEGEALRLRLATLDETWQPGGASPWDDALKGQLTAWSYESEEPRRSEAPRLETRLGRYGIRP